MTNHSRFEKPGTIGKPGPLGRIARLFSGIVHLYFFVVLLTEGEWLLSTTIPSHPGWWLGIAWGLYVLPRVVNIGFTLSWGKKPQLAIVLLALGASVFSLVQYESIWGPPLGWLVLVWLVYVYGHLGLSFMLAALVGSPGCEMRAIPYIWTKITGRETKEHYCPGSLGRLDRWEAARPGTATGS